MAKSLVSAAWAGTLAACVLEKSSKGIEHSCGFSPGALAIALRRHTAIRSTWPIASPMVRSAWLWCALLLAAVFACGGGGSRGLGSTQPLSTREHDLFDDGVDLIENPEGLSGRWKEDWDRDLNDRLASSDLVVTGTVTTLRSEVDPERRTSYHLVFDVDRALVGEPGAGEIVLISRDGDTGYGSVVQHRDHVLRRSVLAFIKYGAGPDGTSVPHFHLAAPSQVALKRIHEYNERKTPNRVVVIERAE
jgi:hypothetical protein